MTQKVNIKITKPKGTPAQVTVHVPMNKTGKKSVGIKGNVSVTYT